MIDFHTHIFPDRIAKSTRDILKVKCETEPKTDATAEGLRASSREAGIDCSIILPVVTKPKQFDSITRFAMQFRGEDRLLSFGGIHPQTEDYKKELKYLKDQGFKGIKLHPDYQQEFIDDIKYKRIISYASELGLIVSTHAGYDPGYKEVTHCTPQRIINMIEDVRPDRLILAHMGSFLMWDEVERELIGIPAWFDTGVVFDYIEDEQFMRIARKQGIDRILFATDSPWGDQKSFVEHMNRLPFTEEEKQMIFHSNAEKLLDIKIPVHRE
ncbi:MAG: TatD family hydrolase [Eubacteriales bacterium]|nr:TatD family hydrolase [Eubacteriales bacterium]